MQSEAPYNSSRQVAKERQIAQEERHKRVTAERALHDLEASVQRLIPEPKTREHCVRHLPPLKLTPQSRTPKHPVVLSPEP
jgi:hypothetical protein